MNTTLVFLQIENSYTKKITQLAKGLAPRLGPTISSFPGQCLNFSPSPYCCFQSSLNQRSSHTSVDMKTELLSSLKNMKCRLKTGKKFTGHSETYFPYSPECKVFDEKNRVFYGADFFIFTM